MVDLPLSRMYLLVMRNSIINRRFRYTFSNVAVTIAIANIVIFGITYFLFPRLLYVLSMSPVMIVYRHWYWQFVSYMFMHGSLWHLFFNMLALFMFGSPVERQIGSREFLLFYFLTGILSGVASFFYYCLAGSYGAVLLGASGAIYGVMLLFSVFFPSSVVLLFGFIPMRAPTLVLLYFCIEFFGSLFSSGSVGHATHLFGLLFAFLYVLIRMRIKPWKAWGL